MRLKLDENLPESLLAALGALGHDADNVRLEGLAGKADGSCGTPYKPTVASSSRRIWTLPTCGGSRPERTLDCFCHGYACQAGLL